MHLLLNQLGYSNDREPRAQAMSWILVAWLQQLVKRGDFVQAVKKGTV